MKQRMRFLIALALAPVGLSGLGIDPTSHRVYIADESDNSVSVIDGELTRGRGGLLKLLVRRGSIAVLLLRLN